MSAINLSIAHIAAQKDLPFFSLYRPKQTGGWEFDYVKLTAFLTTRGYFLYRTSVTKHILIRIMDNIVREVGKKDLKDEILSFITTVEDVPEHIHQFFLKNIGKAVNDEFLETLPAKQVDFKKDKKDAMQLYYQNCIVKVKPNKVSTHPYSELDGYIWESQILPRNFEIQEFDPMCEMARFITNISNNEQKRFDSTCSALGFMLHNYKNPAYCPAVILNDEVISDSPEGGTGKGIIIKAIERFLTTATVEGKTFSFDSNFVYQRVNTDTKLLFFQDVNKNFDFERLFSVLTDGINVEKKGKDAFYLSFSDAPKIAITTNYAIRGGGNSHERRRFEIEISQYYNKNKTPFTEFGRMMFIDWDQAEWYRFDNFMISCCQLYLQKGLIHQELINLPAKRLMAELSPDFSEFIEDNIPEKRTTIQRTAVYDRFKSNYPNSRLASRTFYQQLKKYCDFHQIKCNERKSNGVMYFDF